MPTWLFYCEAGTWVCMSLSPCQHLFAVVLSQQLQLRILHMLQVGFGWVLWLDVKRVGGQLLHLVLRLAHAYVVVSHEQQSSAGLLHYSFNDRPSSCTSSWVANLLRCYTA